jgi:quercetin dioxygenase-like cupin family protein
MASFTRLYTDHSGYARFEDVEMSLAPSNPPPNVMSVSEPWSASGVLFGRGPAGGSHPEQPEHRRQLIIGLSGSVEVTATGETRTFGPGDVLLAEDTTGVGHSSRSAVGFVAAVVLLEPPQ